MGTHRGGWEAWLDLFPSHFIFDRRWSNSNTNKNSHRTWSCIRYWSFNIMLKVKVEGNLAGYSYSQSYVTLLTITRSLRKPPDSLASSVHTYIRTNSFLLHITRKLLANCLNPGTKVYSYVRNRCEN